MVVDGVVDGGYIVVVAIEKLTDDVEKGIKWCYINKSFWLKMEGGCDYGC